MRSLQPSDHQQLWKVTLSLPRSEVLESELPIRLQNWWLVEAPV